MSTTPQTAHSSKSAVSDAMAKVRIARSQVDKVKKGRAEHPPLPVDLTKLLEDVAENDRAAARTQKRIRQSQR